MKKATFELDWNDIHEAISSHVKDKAIHLFTKEGETTKKEDIHVQSFLSFEDKEGNQLQVESVRITVKRL